MLERDNGADVLERDNGADVLERDNGADVLCISEVRCTRSISNFFKLKLQLFIYVQIIMSIR